MTKEEYHKMIKVFYENVIPCRCGGKGYRPINGYLNNTIEMLCSSCGRSAEYKGRLEEYL